MSLARAHTAVVVSITLAILRGRVDIVSPWRKNTHPLTPRAGPYEGRAQGREADGRFLREGLLQVAPGLGQRDMLASHQAGVLVQRPSDEKSLAREIERD